MFNKKIPVFPPKNVIFLFLQECLQQAAELTRKVTEARRAAEAVFLCEEALASLEEAVGSSIGQEEVLIALAVYTALSMVWGLARVIYAWKYGPQGGRFPPDELFAQLIITMTFACLNFCRTRLEKEEPRVAIVPATAPGIEMLTIHSRKDLEERTEDDAEANGTGLQGPAYYVLDRPSKNLQLRTRLTQIFQSAPSPVLKDATSEWVEATASRRAQSELTHSTMLTTEQEIDQSEATSAFGDCLSLRSRAEELMESSGLERTEADLDEEAENTVSTYFVMLNMSISTLSL